MVTVSRKLFTVSITALVLVGCRLEPMIDSAESHRDGDMEIVQVSISAANAAKIKSRELYTYLRVGDCLKMAEGYPAEAYIDGQRVSGFAFATVGATVKVSGSVPVRIFEGYQSPCVTLDGGGYFSGTISSAVVPLVRKDARR